MALKLDVDHIVPVVRRRWAELLPHRLNPGSGPSTDSKSRVDNVAHLEGEVLAAVTHLPYALDGARQYKHFMHTDSSQADPVERLDA